MPKRRILDERAGEPCDYKLLAGECRALVKEEGLTWREAATQVAEAANRIERDSIIRNLNRYREDRPRSVRTASILPGEAVLYDAISEKLHQLERQLDSLDATQAAVGHEDRPFAGMAEQAAAIRALLDRRLNDLDSMAGEESLRHASRVLGRLEVGSLSAGALIQRERGRLSSLIERVRQLQYRIDDSRPGPYTIRNY